MYAILRQYTYDAEKRAELEHALAVVGALHAAQPGYAGGLLIDDAQRLVAVNLWESQWAAHEGRAAIGVQVQRVLEPLMTGPSELIAAGEVRANDKKEEP